MSAPGQAVGPSKMTCEEVADLAGLHALGVLETSEREAVITHLATCPEAHDELRELGGVVPALASLAEPVDAPTGLKARVMDAVAREAAASSRPVMAPVPVGAEAPAGPGSLPRALEGGFPTRARAAWRVPAWASWGAAVAAVLILAVVGVWAVGLQSRVDEANRRSAVLGDAIAALSAPGSSVAVLRPTGSNQLVGSGFAAITEAGGAYIVMIGLPEAPSGQTYQAWYIADGSPTSAGLVTVDDDGYAVLADNEVPSGTQIVALTLEPAGGSELPTSDPFAIGELQPV